MAFRDRYDASVALHHKAQRVMPGGVNSPSRLTPSYPALPPTVYVDSGSGCRISDADSNSYVDFHLAAGAALFGHASTALADAIYRRARFGSCFAASHRLEADVANRLADLIPTMERVRFVTSGSEAVCAALQAARAATERQEVLVFGGCYHGWLNLAPGLARLPLNDSGRLRSYFASRGREVAAALIEPVPASQGVIPVDTAFLRQLRSLCSANNVVLVFDEIITGLRCPSGSAQELLGVRPDLTVVGKVLGGGLPIAAYGGLAEVMAAVAPDGDVYQGGTFAAHPLALEAALHVLNRLDARVYATLEEIGHALETGVRHVARTVGAGITVVRRGSFMSLYSGSQTPRTETEATMSALTPWPPMFEALLRSGVFVQAQPSKPWFLSTAHDRPAIEQTLGALPAALRLLEAQP